MSLLSDIKFNLYFIDHLRFLTHHCTFMQVAIAYCYFNQSA